MSTLKTHDLEDIVAVTPGGDESPGNFVRHVEDKNSLGTVVAHDPRPQGFSKQAQVTVLWSKEPPNHWPEPLFSGSITGFNQNGYVFVPYVPKKVTPAIFSTGSISPIRYGSKPVNQGFYGMVCLTSGSI